MWGRDRERERFWLLVYAEVGQGRMGWEGGKIREGRVDGGRRDRSKPHKLHWKTHGH